MADILKKKNEKMCMVGDDYFQRLQDFLDWPCSSSFKFFEAMLSILKTASFNPSQNSYDKRIFSK